MKRTGSKIPKISDSPMKKNGNEEQKHISLEDLHALMVAMDQKFE